MPQKVKSVKLPVCVQETGSQDRLNGPATKLLASIRLKLSGAVVAPALEPWMRPRGRGVLRVPTAPAALPAS